MKLILGSDLHGNLPEVPKCDTLILAGDILPETEQEWFVNTRLRHWLSESSARTIVATGGNHDHRLFKRGNKFKGLRWHLLIDQSVVVDGIKFHGTPWCLPIGRWAWQAPEYVLEKIYGMIPDDVDIVVSHTPPYMILDKTDADPIKSKPSEYAGSRALRDRMTQLNNLKLLVCGHIHEAQGRDGIVINASCLDRNYVLRSNPWTEIKL